MKEVKSIYDLREMDFNEAVVVFSQDSFSREYSEESRSYSFTKNEKFFQDDSISNSLHGKCLDGTESIRLDYYLFEPDVTGQQWTVEKIYIKE